MKNKWNFLKNIFTPLTPNEAEFWRNEFRSILKVGVELEFNLSKRVGCLYDGIMNCPCPESFKDCKGYKTCISNTCMVEDKTECEKSPDCPEFIPRCWECARPKERGCINCLEWIGKHVESSVLREVITTSLKPSRTLTKVNELGVFDVKTDGSLFGDGGVEILTIGRRMHFNAMYESISKIIRIVRKNGGWLNERCSTHMHLLASYLPGGDGTTLVSELERPIPQIILINFHQLVRRYHVALAWITSCGAHKNTLTRWGKFRLPVMQFSPLSVGMPVIKQNMESNPAGNDLNGRQGKYYFINYFFTEFNKSGDVSRLHIESRWADGCFSPAVITAWACLLYALMLKAVDLSVYGAIFVCDKKAFAEKKRMLDSLVNGISGYGSNRDSDTSGFEKYIPAVIEETRDLVGLVKNGITDMYPAYDIL
ncbi:MAG: hypothetical protein JRG73_11655, partial [Deltaproteobacteria bacterium]|nr:hypothetical protein [Deltaproteobacteria bacterium]